MHLGCGSLAAHVDVVLLDLSLKRAACMPTVSPLLPTRCSDVVGFRAPFLETKPEQRQVLYENGFLYDRCAPLCWAALSWTVARACWGADQRPNAAAGCGCPCGCALILCADPCPLSCAPIGISVTGLSMMSPTWLQHPGGEHQGAVNVSRPGPPRLPLDHGQRYRH